MKKLSYLLTLTILFSSLIISCNKDDDPQPSPSVTLENPVNKFVWKAMNSWYNWQADVPNLADTKDDNTTEFYSYLNTYSNPENLFYDVCYKHISNVGAENAVDRFSWFIDDYVEQQKQFQGISTTFGMRLQAVLIDQTTGEIIFYVRFVSKNSPAENAGIQRGDIIKAINGTEIFESNYSTVTAGLGGDTVTLTLVDEENGTFTTLGDKTITAVELADNPVYLTKVFTNVAGKKVGYLVYNGFRSSYNDELNAAFATFKSEDIQELVLDLRLNGGGSVETSTYLASMINASAGEDKFAELKFNAKHSNENGYYYFKNNMNVYDVQGNKTGTEVINRLSNLTRLYVLTSSSTASASEMIINGLKPFMEVITVGTQTYGKNVGSITLYDSPTSQYTNVNSANSSHLYAMQPIVFQIYNKNGESDYINGFAPNIEVKEWHYWKDILPLGDENEVVLKAALNQIAGVTSNKFPLKEYEVKKEEVSQLTHKFDKEMYIDHNYFIKNQ